MLSILSWNVNDASVSNSAPSGWSLPQQHHMIVAEILRHAPDILILQVWYDGVLLAA